MFGTPRNILGHELECACIVVVASCSFKKWLQKPVLALYPSSIYLVLLLSIDLPTLLTVDCVDFNCWKLEDAKVQQQ